ncbi:class I SAM-dependent methyltransferase [Verrucomicrobiales bacterium]|nr:class I SAM-dependent methyltransferase [Verrucomicrobiales bacterium]
MGKRYESGDWYQAPLWYDIIFDRDTEREADFLESVRVAHGLSLGRRVLEPACGTGRILIELASRGWDCSGFDAESAMVEFADLRAQQEHVRDRVTVWEDRMEAFSLMTSSGFDLAFALLSTFKYLTEEKHVSAFLNQVSHSLAPGGIFVLGTHLTDYSLEKPEHERWVGERDGVRVVCNTRTWPADSKTRLEKMRNRLEVIQDGEHAARVETLWDVRSYSANELRATIEKVPDLEVAATYDFDYDLGNPLTGWKNSDTVVLVLRKTPC